jgi:ubiquinone/menaquinone biosynthesis C-methylase UbiE
MTEPHVDADAFRAFERRAHDEVAAGYRDFFTSVTQYAIEPLLDAACVRPDSRVVDVATGPGLLAARAAARRARRVVGIDIAPRMVAIAAAQYPGVDFREGDAENLPFDDDSFDAVLCNFGIGHFPRPERAVAEFARILAPGGTVAISWWDVPARHRLNGIFFDAFQEARAAAPPDLPVGPPMFRFSDDETLRDLLRSAALDAVTVRACSHVHRLASPDALWDGILAGTVRTSIGIRRQSVAVRNQIRNAFDRLMEPYVRDDGVHMPVAFKVGAGRKREGPLR